MDEGTIDNDWGDESAAPQMTNKRFRLLVERAHNTGDYEATLELLEYLLSKMHKKVATFPPAERQDLVGDLLEAAASAMRATVSGEIERPRNYVIRALSNRYVTELRKLLLRTAEQPAESLDEEEGDQDDGVLPSPRTLSVEDVHNIVLLHDFIRTAQTVVARKVGQVMMVSYAFSVTEAEASYLMDFGVTETATVLRTLRRWRQDPDSTLFKRFRRDEGGN